MKLFGVTIRGPRGLIRPRPVLSFSKWGFVFWPNNRGNGYQFHFHSHGHFKPNLETGIYGNFYNGDPNRKLLVFRGFFLHIWLDCGETNLCLGDSWSIPKI